MAPAGCENLNPIKKLPSRKKVPSQYLDQLKFELNISEFLNNEGVQRVVSCGFFKWTFAFHNMSIDHEFIKKKLASRKTTKKYAQKKEKKRAVKLRKPRQGFLLSAECEPDNKSMEGNPNLAFSRWRVNAMIIPNWKESHLQGQRRKKVRVKEIDRGWLFTNRVSWHAIKHYYPRAFDRQESVLLIKLRVFRISNLSPSISGPDFVEGPNKICLTAGTEQIYVERAFIEFHSPVLLESINRGEGTSKEMPIRIDSRFKPLLVKLAICVLGFKAQFYVLNIPDLLDFATTYGFHTLLQLVELRLINKRCAKLSIENKLELAYKHQLRGLIVEFSRRINKPTEIERHLKMKNLPVQFEELLKRKKEAIAARVSELIANKKEKRDRKREKGHKK